MTTVKELSAINTEKLQKLLKELKWSSANDDTSRSHKTIEEISNLLIPAEKFARQMIEFGTEVSKNNVHIIIYPDGYYGLEHSSTVEIVDDFVNNGKIIL